MENDPAVIQVQIVPDNACVSAACISAHVPKLIIWDRLRHAERAKTNCLAFLSH